MPPRTPRSEQHEPRKSNLELVTNAQANSFLGKIVQTINKATTDLMQANPDTKHNTGRQLGEAYMWDEIEKYAAAMSKRVWEKLESDKVITTTDLTPGGHMIADAPHFTIMAEVTQPVRRFSGDALAKWLEKEKKIPIIVTKEQIEKAKLPTTSQVKLKVVAK